MSETETVLQDVQDAAGQQSEKPGKKKKEKIKKPLWREILEWAVTFAVAAAIALTVRGLLFEPIRVQGSSMAETLVDGEIMFVTKPEYLTGDPQRFDVVICHYPDRGNTNFVKRVAGIPGDMVEVRDGFLYVNGEKYDEDYLTYRPNYNVPLTYIPRKGDVIAVEDGQLTVNGQPTGITRVSGWQAELLQDGSYTVEEDQYYVLGDNRANSNDSHLVGPITRSMIKGHVRSVIWPINGWRGIE